MAKIKGKPRCFVVSLVIEGKKHYLESEQVGILDPKTMKPIREPLGFFVTDLVKAMKWTDKWWAEMVASAYDGAVVEIIKTGEVLK